MFLEELVLSFQSNLNLPTPDDYVVGAGDKLFIDIYGQSEAYYQAEISRKDMQYLQILALSMSMD